MSADAFTTRTTDWPHDAQRLREVRTSVFIVEQRIPAEMEFDRDDHLALHVLAEDDHGLAIGCARLLVDGHIGRVAVLRAWRGRGVGDALMRVLLDVARTRGHRRIVLHAQLSALGFYAQLGFVVTGAVFDEAGIAHQAMLREL